MSYRFSAEMSMNVELRFTDKEITAWGGMGLMKGLLDHLRFNQVLEKAQLPQPGSNRGYRPEQLIVQFMLSVWCAANRLEHSEVMRSSSSGMTLKSISCRVVSG